MRLLRVAVPRDDLEAARNALEEFDATFVAVPTEGDDGVVLETPLPSDAIGDALEALEDAGIETGEYTVIASGEASMTATSEELEEEYVGDYNPLTGVELRSKARDLSQDPTTYAALMILSALIATAGLLTDSPAIVVGSMVIAPIIGPALTASVGAVTSDRKMVVDSLWMQLYGLALAIGSSALLAALLRFGGFVADPLDLTVLDLVGVRIAPNALSLVVGVAAGVAAGVGLTTKGPTSIIGVMIAAALIPTAGATGIAIAWVEPALVIGTAILLFVTLVVINLAIFTVLYGLGYHERDRPQQEDSSDWSRPTVATLAIVIAAVTLAVVAATAGQIAVDREVVGAAEDALEEPAHGNLTAVAVRTQYADMSPFTGPRTVTVVVSEDGDGDPATLAADVADRIAERTGEDVEVRIETVSYESSRGNESRVSSGVQISGADVNPRRATRARSR